MKIKFLPLIFFIFILILIPICFNNKTEVKAGSYDYLRIHINANSCAPEDQEIKIQIRDKLLSFLTDSISKCKSKMEAEQILQDNIEIIKAIANSMLDEEGFSYGAYCEIKNEYFPTRYYENCVVEAGNYDALVITLGEGEGDNWWCVVYPPLCFVNKNSLDEQNIVYQSKILDKIKKYFK